MSNVIKIKKSKLLCPMSLSLMDPAGNETRRIECILPRMHRGRCTDGSSVWQMPKRFLDRLEKQIRDERRVKKAK